MIDQDEALAIAQNHAEKEGWAFSKPIHVLERKKWWGTLDRYEIETGHGLKGTKANFVIDAKTGEIRSSGYIPR